MTTALSTARLVAEELVERGASAVVLPVATPAATQAPSPAPTS